jgi:DNA-binding LacI/PurR family transcriptional regulator
MAAAQEAVLHLARQGRKRIGTITGKLDNREGKSAARLWERNSGTPTPLI